MSRDSAEKTLLQLLHTKDDLHLAAGEPQTGQPAHLAQHCPCWRQPECAACKGFNTQQDSEAALQQTLADNVASLRALQAEQQLKRSLYQEAQRERQASIKDMEDDMQHANSKLQDQEDYLQYGTMHSTVSQLCNPKPCIICCSSPHRTVKQELDAVACQQHKLDGDQRVAGQAVEALTMSLFAAKSLPPSVRSQVTMKVIILHKPCFTCHKMLLRIDQHYYS